MDGADRLLRQLLAFFAAASLLLAGVGIYGLITGVLGGLYFTSVFCGLFFLFSYRARVIHPPTFVGGSLLLAIVTLTTCYLTARKAAKIDPQVSLRSE